MLIIATGHTLARVNQVVRKAQKSVEWFIKAPVTAERFHEMLVVVGTDGGSLGHMPREGSQIGVAVMFAAPEVLQGSAPVVLMEAFSQKMRRTVRSSMAVEIGGATVGLEHGILSVHA